MDWNSIVKIYQGVGVSRGIALGQAWIHQSQEHRVDQRMVQDISEEILLLNQAITSSRDQLQTVYDEAVHDAGDDAEIILVQIEFLEDEALLDRIIEGIRRECWNAAYAVESAFQHYKEMFDAMDDPYFKERIVDLRDVTNRLIQNLNNDAGDRCEIPENSIVFAEDLTPSETLQMDKSRVLGFVTCKGSRTSHVSILANALEIPAIVGTENMGLNPLSDAFVAIDGQTGMVYIEPDNDIRAQLQLRAAHHAERIQAMRDMVHKDARTLDGRRIQLYGNMGQVEEVSTILRNGGEGVGLFRTEFLYVNRPSLPTEEKQYHIYKAVLERMGERPVIVRTMDIGGDKDVQCITLPVEDNPFLGYRGIRVSLDHEMIFETQLRALLRASVYGVLRIMFPMVATVSELQQAKVRVSRLMNALKDEGIPFSDDIQVGIMIEVPSAVMMADALANECDFFSIGTNDLTQYLFAADRNNPSVAHLGAGFDPALIRMIHRTVECAHQQGIWVGICGEVAGDPAWIPLLIAMGVDELSMSGSHLLDARERVEQLDCDELQQRLGDTLAMATAEEVRGMWQDV